MVTAAPRATAVLVTYRSAGIVDAALEALRPGVERGRLRVVVVDNASPDGTADRIEIRHSWARLIRSPRNLGYGRGCNAGFREVATPYVLFMNPDVVITPEAVEGLADFLDAHPEAGAVAPATRLAGREWQHAGGLATPWAVMAKAAGRFGPAPRQRRVKAGDPDCRVDWLCGAVFLVRSALFRRLGEFDERYFLYFEETDLCRRISMSGASLWVAGGVQACHGGGASARAVDPSLREGECLSEHFYASRYYYLVKHYGRLWAALAEGFELAAMSARDLARLVLGRPPRRELRARRSAPLFRMPRRSL